MRRTISLLFVIKSVCLVFPLGRMAPRACYNSPISSVLSGSLLLFIFRFYIMFNYFISIIHLCSIGSLCKYTNNNLIHQATVRKK